MLLAYIAFMLEEEEEEEESTPSLFAEGALAVMLHPAIRHLGRRRQGHVSHAHHGPLADVARGVLVHNDKLLQVMSAITV